jgi:hypothetical protein
MNKSGYIYFVLKASRCALIVKRQAGKYRLTGLRYFQHHPQMPDRPPLRLQDTIWIRSGLTDQQYIFRSLRNALVERGITVLTLNGPDDKTGLERIRKVVWGSNAHVILDGMMPHELKKLRPVFQERKNFSMALVDWWTSVYWFTRNADYLIFRNYNGIAVRRGLARFMAGRSPPLIALPDKMTRYAVIRSALRLPALAVAPFWDIWKSRQRRRESFPPERLLYFPFTIADEYDFANVSSTGGYWIMRDPHASAWLTYGDLYCDRLRITDMIWRSDSSYRVFDLRRSHYLNWDEYCRITRASRFAIATGGLHQNSVAKYAEFACLGTPMFGEEIPFEYPWLKQCLFPVDTLNVTREQLKPKLREALALQSKLRENCLNLRDTLFKLYNPHRILDLLQEQADGKPIPSGYLKPEAFGSESTQN